MLPAQYEKLQARGFTGEMRIVGRWDSEAENYRCCESHLFVDEEGKKTTEVCGELFLNWTNIKRSVGQKRHEDN